MKRYWDYTERERSELTEEQVRSMLDRELMESGVQRCEPPELLPVNVPELASTPVWCIRQKDNHWSMSDVGYTDADAAQAALKNAVWLQHEYLAGEASYVAKPCSLVIECKQLISSESFLAAKAALDEAKSNKEANDKALKDYNAAYKCVTECCEGVWDDFRDCQAKARRHQKIIDTRAEYVALCDGSDSLADTFLEKTFGADEVAAAKEWFGLNVMEEIAQPAEL